MPLASIVAFIFKWSVGVAVMTCDIIFDVTVSLVLLLEMIVIEMFSVMGVLVIDVPFYFWKTDWKGDDIVDLTGTHTRDNNMADDGTNEDDDTASSSHSVDTSQATETGSGSNELRINYRHLKQEYKKKRKTFRTHPEEIVGSAVVI